MINTKYLTEHDINRVVVYNDKSGWLKGWMDGSEMLFMQMASGSMASVLVSAHASDVTFRYVFGDPNDKPMEIDGASRMDGIIAQGGKVPKGIHILDEASNITEAQWHSVRASFELTDYRDLLKKYMMHVYDSEGVTYAPPSGGGHVKFTQPEMEVLDAIEKEVEDEY